MAEIIRVSLLWRPNPLPLSWMQIRMRSGIDHDVVQLPSAPCRLLYLIAVGPPDLTQHLFQARVVRFNKIGSLDSEAHADARAFCACDSIMV